MYRGERSSITPERAFSEGFTPKGSHSNLEDHLLSNTTAGNFVSTSSSKNIAESFAGKNGYVYEIKTSNFIDVNNILGSRSPFPEQLEHSFPGGIMPNEIIGAYVKKNGVLTGEFIPNPFFRR
ncbi:enterotoxin A family protein [Bacillus sp. SM2101]|uniref:enterotoxin A family protein n=1 Tax=Bacillus sp. SM2101 TaxID=2805366 RepID=UPI001BDE6E94